MHCAEFEHRLNDLLDQRLRPETDAGLCAHARQCAPCGNRLDTQELLFEGLAGLRVTGPRETLSAKVLSAWQGSVQPARPRWDRARTWFPWVAAAGILIAAGLALVPRTPQPADPLIAKTISTVTTPQPTRAEVPVKIDEEYFQIARDTGETVALALRWPGVPLDTPPTMADRGYETPEWFEDVANGIRPLTHSMGAAIEVLRSSIPSGSRSG